MEFVCKHWRSGDFENTLPAACCVPPGNAWGGNVALLNPKHSTLSKPYTLMMPPLEAFDAYATGNHRGERTFLRYAT